LLKLYLIFEKEEESCFIPFFDIWVEGWGPSSQQSQAGWNDW
jgi:hypothetical protein